MLKFNLNKNNHNNGDNKMSSTIPEAPVFNQIAIKPYGESNEEAKVIKLKTTSFIQSQTISKAAKVALKVIVALGIVLTLGLPLLSKSFRLLAADLFFAPSPERDLKRAKISLKKGPISIQKLEEKREKTDQMLFKRQNLTVERFEQIKQKENDAKIKQQYLSDKQQYLSEKFEEARYDLENSQKIAKNMGSKPQHNLEEITERAQMMQLATRTSLEVKPKSPEKITREDILNSIREAKAKKAETYMEKTTKKVATHVENNSGRYTFILGALILGGMAAASRLKV
ncbi:putative uncharacterized protein [Waddlia chondrophila 2032/99]|uniref:Uncharacterized protein n=1 Tax=Waddlia chondrophila 2032/99 TaxID=765953 RepID=F8LE26_9BACT|nr:putative uncharacterized protein [Waddlia chondrophila 2032/99]